MLLEHRNNHLTLTKKFECIYNSENIKTTNEYIILQGMRSLTFLSTLKSFILKKNLKLACKIKQNLQNN